MKKKIIVIDHERDFLDLAEAALQEDFEVIKLQDTASAVKLCRDSRPDAVLLDVSTYGTDGGDLLRRLREDSETNHIPVVAMTALRIDSAAKARLKIQPNVHSVLDKFDGVSAYHSRAMDACR